jgi:hypothetical protein
MLPLQERRLRSSHLTGIGRAGFSYAVFNSGTTRVGATQLDGATVMPSGILVCAGVYDEILPSVVNCGLH